MGGLAYNGPVLEEEKADTVVLDGAQAHLQNTLRVSETSSFSVLAPQAPPRG